MLGLDVAAGAGRGVAMVTITAPGRVHVGELRNVYGRALERLRRRRGERRRIDGVCCVEFSATAPFQPHLHIVLLHDGLTIRRIEDAFRAAGAGHVRARRIGRSAEDRAAVAGYLTKSNHAAAVELRRGGDGQTKVRPVTFSRGYPSITDG